MRTQFKRAACGVRRAACGVRRAACGVRRAATSIPATSSRRVKPLSPISMFDNPVILLSSSSASNGPAPVCPPAHSARTGETPHPNPGTMLLSQEHCPPHRPGPCHAGSASWMHGVRLPSADNHPAIRPLERTRAFGPLRAGRPCTPGKTARETLVRSHRHRCNALRPRSPASVKWSRHTATPANPDRRPRNRSRACRRRERTGSRVGRRSPMRMVGRSARWSPPPRAASPSSAILSHGGRRRVTGGGGCRRRGVWRLRSARSKTTPSNGRSQVE